MIQAIGLGFCQHALFGFGGISPPTTHSVSNIARDFFSDVFRHPSHHMIVILFFSAILIAAIVGTLFLIKKIYEKSQQANTPPPP